MTDQEPTTEAVAPVVIVTQNNSSGCGKAILWGLLVLFLVFVVAPIGCTMLGLGLSAVGAAVVEEGAR